jgi:protein-disulfide isomerase
VIEDVFKDVRQTNPEEVKLVIKSLPIFNHRFAMKAAIAARAAHGQGKFREFHHTLFDR